MYKISHISARPFAAVAVKALAPAAAAPTQALKALCSDSTATNSVWTVNATDLAIKILGRAITNTAMLGAIVKATGVVKLESIIEATKERFPEEIAEKNIELIKKAYEEAVKG